MKRIFTFLIAATLAVVLFELFLRYSPFGYGISPAVYDKDLGQWHKKNFSSIEKSICFRTRYYLDERGLVKNNYPYDPAKQDVILLGDSYLENFKVKNPNLMHNVLYTLYGGKYNFLNYGYSGTSAVQQYMILKTKADLNHTKTVIQFVKPETDIFEVDPANFDATMRPKVFLNFHDLDHFTVIPPKPYDTKERIRDLLGNLELYTFARKGIYVLRKKLSGDENSSTPYKNREGEDFSKNWLQLNGAIYQTAKLLKNHHIDYTVIIAGEDATFKNRLKRFLEKEHIAFYDLREIAKKEHLEIPSFSCDKHWNDTAHRNIAKLIKRENIVH